MVLTIHKQVRGNDVRYFVSVRLRGEAPRRAGPFKTLREARVHANAIRCEIGPPSGDPGSRSQ